jgi:hypothetical protein
VIPLEIVGGEEQEDTTARLIANGSRLPLGRGSREKDGGPAVGRARRPDHDPALALLGLVGVLTSSNPNLPT